MRHLSLAKIFVYLNFETKELLLLVGILITIRGVTDIFAFVFYVPFKFRGNDLGGHYGHDVLYIVNVSDLSARRARAFST